MRNCIRISKAMTVIGIVLVVALSAIAQPTSGLLANYPFTGNTNDVSGNGVHLTAQTGVSGHTDRWGVGNCSYYFIGNSTSSMRANVGSAFSVSNVTLSAWINVSGAGTNSPRLIAVGPAGGANHSYQLFLNGTGTPRTLSFNGVSSTQTIATENRWTHVAVTYNGAQVRFYINGALSSTVAHSSPLATFSNAVLQVGYNDNGLDRFNGMLDEVRIYNRALSASEIYQCYSPTNGLLMYYPLNGTGDSTRHTGAMSANAVVSSADRFGRANECYTFNGSSSYIKQIVETGFSVTNVSLCAWVRIDGPGRSYPRILAVGPTGSSSQYYTMYLDGTGNPRRISFNGVNSTQTIATDGKWRYVVTTFDGANIKFYIDGVLSSTVAHTNPLPTFTGSALIQVGFSDINNDHFAGIIDEIRIYNRAISASEVSELASMIPTPQGLVASYPFSGNANDVSGYGNNGSTTPGVNNVTDRYGTANSALSFNGTTGRMTVPNSTSLGAVYVTASAWVNISGFNNTQGQTFLARFSNGTTTNPAFSLELQSPTGVSGTYTYPNLVIWTSDGVTNHCFAASPIPLNQWTLLTGTYDGTTSKLYINGVLSNSTSKTGMMNQSPWPLEVGGHANNVWYTNGKIDDVRMYN